MEEHEPKRGGAGCAIGCLVLAILVPVLYVLGYAPAALTATHYPATEPWLEIIYAPMLRLRENSPIVQAALDWYVGLLAG